MSNLEKHISRGLDIESRLTVSLAKTKIDSHKHPMNLFSFHLCPFRLQDLFYHSTQPLGFVTFFALYIITLSS